LASGKRRRTAVARTDTGFYYDIDLDHKFTADDLEKIEAEMKKIADENQPFLRKEVAREEAVEIIKSRGQERYKLGRPAGRRSRSTPTASSPTFAPARTCGIPRS